MKQYEVPSIELVSFQTREMVANEDDFEEFIDFGMTISPNSPIPNVNP